MMASISVCPNALLDASRIISHETVAVIHVKKNFFIKAVLL
jgi:hypothetical protein